jgi:hypothetical protein
VNILIRDFYFIVIITKAIIDLSTEKNYLIMGATNEIKGTNISLKLEGLSCSHCSQKFTEKEIEDRNFDI